eukprot:2603680-Rhodomonas_salina.2
MPNDFNLNISDIAAFFGCTSVRMYSCQIVFDFVASCSLGGQAPPGIKPSPVYGNQVRRSRGFDAADRDVMV